MFDLSASPLPIPDHFHKVRYNAECYPGAAGLRGFDNGANCQHFAYEFIRHFGCVIPDFRSSNLWEDTEYTYEVKELEVFDLVMVHKNKDSYGAHVGVYIGENFIFHLSKRNDFPAIETLEALRARPEYKYFIGAKRCKIRP